LRIRHEQPVSHLRLELLEHRGLAARHRDGERLASDAQSAKAHLATTIIEPVSRELQPIYFHLRP
jgi:hypothetical protein